MEVEKRGSKGGFLQLFDWNVKSRKKLFSNKSDLSESSKEGKENLDNLDISQSEQMKIHQNMHGPSPIGSDYASSFGNDEGCGSKAPGVVAKLMGLDSLPTSDPSEPSFSPFIHSHSFRHAYQHRIITDFASEHHFMDYDMRNKLDGFTRNPVEDRLQKLKNRPIERFQTETLPPKSAKSISITHHRLLSPIKSPGFILTRNAAHIMEAASKIIEQSPHSTLNGRLPSFGSSSVPLRIRDLKEKMEAAKHTSRVPEASQRSKDSSVISSKSQPREKRQSGSDEVLMKQSVSGSLKNKNKSGSLATEAKSNVLKGDRTTPRKYSSMNQKEDAIKLARLNKQQKNTPRDVQNRSTTGRASEVLRLNNQKQNCASNKDRVSLKPKVPYQQDRKAGSTNGSSREIKTSKKVAENSAVSATKVKLVTSEAGKELSSSKTKNFSRKKRPNDGNTVFDRNASNNVQIKEKERSVKCNITIDGSSKLDFLDRKNGMDVVSFTFTSPVKKSVLEFESSAPSTMKCRSLNLQDDQPDLETSDLPSLGLPLIDNDALSVLLEQKLKELSYRAETSNTLPSFDVPTTVSASHDQSFHLDTQKDETVNLHDSGFSFVDQLSKKAEQKWQGVEVTECNSRSQNSECVIELPFQYLPTSSNLEPSFSDGSCITSDSTTSLISDGNKHCSSAEFHDMSSSISSKNVELLADEIELQDSASSIPSDQTKVISTTFMAISSQWKLEYIKEMLSYTELFFDDFAFDQTQNVINLDLFDHLENQKPELDKNTNEFFKQERKVLFDFVSVCLELRRKRAFNGSYKEWAKWSLMFQMKDLLADEIYKEISCFTSMEDLMIDELVDKDMSTRHGKWMDFEAEALEEGIVIENGILSSLVDEIIADFSVF